MTTTSKAPNWAPLEARLGDRKELIGEFIWMYTNEVRQIEFYKHSVTRKYLLLRADGRCVRATGSELIGADFESELARVRESEESR